MCMSQWRRPLPPNCKHADQCLSPSYASETGTDDIHLAQFKLPGRSRDPPLETTGLCSWPRAAPDRYPELEFEIENSNQVTAHSYVAGAQKLSKARAYAPIRTSNLTAFTRHRALFAALITGCGRSTNRILCLTIARTARACPDCSSDLTVDVTINGFVNF